MSSDWRPARARLFDLWLAPPAFSWPSAARPAGAASPAAASGPPPQTGPQALHSGRPAEAPLPPPGVPPRTVRVDSRGWTVGVAAAEAAVGVAVECDGIATPPQRLHPAERERLERMPPPERAEARKLLAAARRAMAGALGIPVSAVARAANLCPLLDGAQSLRVGGWTVQRVPAPPGVFVFAAAPGAGWSYALLPAPADAP